MALWEKRAEGGKTLNKQVTDMENNAFSLITLSMKSEKVKNLNG